MTAVSGPVVSLLPARNASADLVGHLESVARYADAVVALDDGSTDDTRAVLEAHPLVHTVLTNPRRDGYEGWDDAENRTRLLDAAQLLSPAWVMSLDSDELISADDAAALRAFLLDDADPDLAYLFRVFRMIEDLDHHDGSELWVGRLFAPRPEHRFPSDRLHFVPLPTAIPRERWRRTTVRIQHRGSLTDAQRRARYDKYGEADPDRRWQGSYEHLLSAPDRLRTWQPRGRLLPVPANEPVLDSEVPAPDEPAMSVVVLANRRARGRDLADIEADVRRAVASVREQELSAPVQILLVADESSLAARLRLAHPGLDVVEVRREAGDGEARNLALASSTGRHVLFIDPATVLRAGHLEALLSAHGAGWPMVAPSFAVDGGSRSAWAAHLLDHSAELAVDGSFTFDVAPRRCSFRREVLVGEGGFDASLPGDAEAAAAWELFDRGYGAFRVGGAVVDRTRSVEDPSSLILDRFRAGRTQGAVLARSTAEGALPPRRALRNLTRSLPGGLRRVDRDVRRSGGVLRRRYRAALPLVAAGALAAWLGALYELARRRVPATLGRRLRRNRSR